jgi:hypothetical protein
LQISNYMRWRVVALISLGVNLAVIALWGISALVPTRSRSTEPSAAANVAEPIKTNLVVRRQFFSWREVESPDYPTYVANLRDIGCPEQTIRDIIIADVNALFTRRRSTEILTPEQQWWRPDPDTNVLQAAAEKVRALDEERRGLLARLLGNNWEAGDLVNLPRPTRPGIMLDGPVLGTLPAETKQALEDVSMRMQDKLQDYLDEQRRQGRTPDRVEMARLRQETRIELQKILIPPQLEEFLLRYSQNANDLRSELGQLRFFTPTPDEFRGIFRATDAIDEQLQSIPPGNDPNNLAQRKSLEDQRENQIKIALGPERYREYQLLHDPIYRDAVAAAELAGSPESAQIIYEINLATAEEQTRIRADTNLTAEQKSIELKRLELEQLQANTAVTGKELPPDPSSVPQPAPRKVFVVGPGDSAATISILYGVPINAIRAANPNLDVNRLRPGDSITIPPNAFVPGAAVR